MRNRLLPALPALLLALAPGASAAQTTLQLRWELVGDSIANDWGASRVAFTLTNRGTKPLPSSGWAIYFNALHSALLGSVGSGFIIEDVIADLHRLAPTAGFAGLAPGASIRIPYLTGLLLNRSFVPQGPYIVFDEAKDVGVPLNDYVALRHEAAVQEQAGEVRDPNACTRRQPSEARCRREAVQVGYHVLYDEPASHASRQRVHNREIGRAHV